MQKSILFNPIIPLNLKKEKQGRKDDYACENAGHKSIYGSAKL